EGNPLFVEEIVSSLRERRLLTPRNGGYAWVAGAVVAFPGTVHDIIQARLDRLDEPLKRTVPTPPLIRPQVRGHLLARVSTMADELKSCLAVLKHLELVHEARFFPELEYMFKHAVIQDAAYQSLLIQRRRVMHGEIGQAIEELYADHLEDHAAILAYHYARSDHSDRAVRYALMAGDRAAGVYANVEAGIHYQQALKAVRTRASSPEDQRFEIDAILKLAGVSMSRVDIQEARTNLLAAHALATRLDDRSRLAQVL